MFIKKWGESIVFLSNNIDFIIALITGLTLILTCCTTILIRALFIKNKTIKTLKFDDYEIKKDDIYKNKLIELIEIKTTSFNDEQGYHQFREKLKILFPNIHLFFSKTKIDGNAIFTYKEHIKDAPNILFATHIDYKYMDQEIKVYDNEVYGNGAFDAKSLLFVMFEAVEELLREEQKLNVNLTMVMTTDDETTKDGVNDIVNQFLKKGNFFDLVIEEGSGIVDQQFFGLRSHYALIGLGVTGEAKIRFKISKGENSYNSLVEFLNHIKYNNLYKSKIDRMAVMSLKEIAKDMNFRYRLFLNNLFIFKKVAKKIIDKKFDKISKMMKTEIIYGDIQETSKEYYIDLTFELSTHDTIADVVLTLAKYMDNYNIEYDILSNKEASKVTRKDNEGYSIVKNAINNVYKDLYIAPIIITKISEKRYFDKVSDCVIRFSPLYYPLQSYKDAFNGNEHVPIQSLNYGVKFFEEILKNYKRR